MLISGMFVLADGGMSWTPETFYAAAAAAHLLMILLAFRIFGLSPEYNTFGGALLVAGVMNAVAFFMKDYGLVGVLVPSVTLFGLLAFISRGDVLRSGMVWMLVMASYLGLAHLILPRADDLFIEDLAGIPAVLDAGGLEPEPFTEDDVERMSRGGGEEREGRRR